MIGCIVRIGSLSAIAIYSIILAGQIMPWSFVFYLMFLLPLLAVVLMVAGAE